MWLMQWILSWWRWFFPLPITYPYEFKYPLSDAVEETEENQKYKRVEEVTPEGQVYLTYDEPTNTFFYWSEKAISYKYLDVVSRKYVIVYDCKEVYVNLFKEIIKMTLKEKEEKKEEEGPFAKFKSYTPKKNYRPLKEKVNQYKYLGKWKEPEPVKEYKSSSYLDYKKQLYGKE
jgi:hypothetical protein